MLGSGPGAGGRARGLHRAGSARGPQHLRIVLQELLAWDGVAPPLWRDLRAPWSPSVGCVDASPRGLGACEA
eukprot:8550695-Pyramimonas_sp.AAC.1